MRHNKTTTTLSEGRANETTTRTGKRTVKRQAFKYAMAPPPHLVVERRTGRDKKKKFMRISA
jgi:hypothetical protein